MQRLPTLILIALLCVPTSLSAALNAGVINGVWFSAPTLVAGTPTTLYSAVQNYSGTTTITGSVAFLVDGAIVGNADFTTPIGNLTAVSTTHVFSEGTHVVSAYITTVSEGAVSYTIVPERTVSVAQNPNREGSVTATTTPAHTQQGATIATAVQNLVSGGGTAVLNESGEVIATVVTPRTEHAATAVEHFRDTLLTASPTTTPASISTQDTEPETTVLSATTTFAKVETPQNLFDVSVEIFGDTDTTPWKKIAAIGLSLLALSIRWWWIFLVIGILVVGWRLVRGERLR